MVPMTRWWCFVAVPLADGAGVGRWIGRWIGGYDAWDSGPTGAGNVASKPDLIPKHASGFGDVLETEGTILIGT